MKAKQSITTTTYKFYILAFFITAFINLSVSNKAYSQLDYYYGLNKSGFRIGAGFGIAQLNTHFSDNPYIATYIGSLDYDFNPYFSIGLEAQHGTLQGIDGVNRLHYLSSIDTYNSGTFNVRVAVGQFDDFDAKNGFEDAVKKIYLGVGIGAIRASNELVDHASTNVGIYSGPVPKGKYLLIPFNAGTNIDLPGVLGLDRLSINPNYQFNYVNSLYLDGFQSTKTSSLKGFYNIISVKLKYKF